MLQIPPTRGRTLEVRPRLDLQEHLTDLEAHGLLVRIDREINKDTELKPLVAAAGSSRRYAGGSRSGASGFMNVINLQKGGINHSGGGGKCICGSPRTDAIGMDKTTGGRYQTTCRCADGESDCSDPATITSPPCQQVVMK